MKDSLCNGQDLKGNVYASEGGTNQSVIEMVKANPNLIGVIGTNWLKGDSASRGGGFCGLRVGGRRGRRPGGAFAAGRGRWRLVLMDRPMQDQMASAGVPRVRRVDTLHTDPRSKSYVRSFYFFAKGQKGQTIICNNSQLLPITPVQIKNVSVE